MNVSHTKKYLAIALVIASFSATAQSGPTESTYSAQFVSIDNDIEEKTEKTAASYRYTKRLSTMYTGYAIELASSDVPLTRDFPAFKNFGKVYYYKTLEGIYSYVILCDFNKKKSVEDYLKNVVAFRVPKAKIVKYENGQIENKNTTVSTKKYLIVD